ncbi:DUF2062 domain-containing protein, partial [Rhizobium ruizarguesonis]
EKMRELLWPRKGFLRPIRYLTIRVLRLSASPHAVAAGVAAVVFVSWTPFIGVHFVMAFDGETTWPVFSAAHTAMTR